LLLFTILRIATVVVHTLVCVTEFSSGGTWGSHTVVVTSLVPHHCSA
jgi:hypothetical protein